MQKKSVQRLTHSSLVLKTQGRSLLGDSLGFCNCALLTLDGLAEQSRVQILNKGQALTKQGKHLQALCLLIHGSLEISVTRADGHRHMVGYVGVGNYVGLVGLLDGKGELNDVYARSESAILVIPAATVRALVPTDPNLGMALAEQLALRNRFMSERLASDPSLPIITRLAKLLCSMHKSFDAIKLSQSELSDWVGASRQRVNFALQKLQKEGLVHIEYSTVTLLNAEALESYAAN
jgi:CRP/FNR family transcriptional regulator, cyclic AMP receptor protein